MGNYTRWSRERSLFTAFLIAGALAIAGFLFIAFRLETRATHYMNAGDRATQRILQAKFLQYNDSYFGGNLPRDTQIVYGPAPDPGVMGDTICNFDGNAPPDCVIYIVPKDNPVMPTAMATLIHETCHVATLGKDFDHGPVWQKCMLNVAEEGGFEGVW